MGLVCTCPSHNITKHTKVRESIRGFAYGLHLTELLVFGKQRCVSCYLLPASSGTHYEVRPTDAHLLASFAEVVGLL